jgi:pectinesterase
MENGSSMKRNILIAAVFVLCNLLFAKNEGLLTTSRFPADKATGVNPDTHLVLTFSSTPALGTSGQIRIYDAADDRLVDALDLSIPPGPTTGIKVPDVPPYTPIPYEYRSGRFTNANTKPGTPSGIALPTPDIYQLTIIGGFTDAFHFYPVTIHGNAATIYPHNNLLDYDRTYYVRIDPGVFILSDSSFSGIKGKTGWTFTTKKSPPSVHSKQIVVCGDGTGDFNTVQGAIDFIPCKNPDRVTILIKNGTYEEIVYFRNKTNITFIGEDREKVVVCYANNEVFNPHPSNVATNEMPGTFPSRRAAFMGDQINGIHLVNLTIKNTLRGQAEGLLLTGEQNIISNVNIEGSGDALQVNGSVYMTDCQIVGDGDIILGRGPAFFDHCSIISHGGTYMWIRNTSANHGNIFLNCKFQTVDSLKTEFARAPINHGKSYPYCEAVLINCALAGISPAGWGQVGGDTSNVHYWEYNSTNISDSKSVDVSKRSPISKQLNKEKDAKIIADYSDPTFVLGGWTPSMSPIILMQPAAMTATAGQTVIFSIKMTAIPKATYQWYRNGKPIYGATDSTLTIEKVLADDAAAYSVSVTNGSGSVTSHAAALILK